MFRAGIFARLLAVSSVGLAGRQEFRSRLTDSLQRVNGKSALTVGLCDSGAGAHKGPPRFQAIGLACPTVIALACLLFCVNTFNCAMHALRYAIRYALRLASNGTAPHTRLVTLLRAASKFRAEPDHWAGTSEIPGTYDNTGWGLVFIIISTHTRSPSFALHPLVMS